jgi:acetyl esterase
MKNSNKEPRMNRYAPRRSFAHVKPIACLTLLVASLAATAPVVAKDTYTIDPVTGTKYKPDDDQMRNLLVTLSSLGGRPIESLSAGQARVQPTLTDAMNVLLTKDGIETDAAKRVPDVTAVDATIPAPGGRTLNATLYTPTGVGPFPTIVYFHGGGWVLENRKATDADARNLANDVQAVVVVVNYRLAPEHKFPAAWDDALTTYQWAAANIGRWRGDPLRLALAGDSAGGTLAIATAISSVTAGITRPKAVIAIYPITQTGTATESYIDSANAKPVGKAAISWFMAQTLNSDSEKTDPRIDLIHAKLSVLPPVTLISAQIDPLRSDGAMLEEALKQANVKVERKEYDGVTHGFYDVAPYLPAAKKAQSYAADQLKDAFKQ